MKTEVELRKMYSGFLPPRVKAQVKSEPTEADIEAARALIARIDGAKRGPGRVRAEPAE